MSDQQEELSVFPKFIQHMKRHRSWPNDGQELKRFYLHQFIQIALCIVLLTSALIQIGLQYSRNCVSQEEVSNELGKIASIIGLVTMRIGFLIEIPELLQIIEECHRFERNLKWRIGRKNLTRLTRLLTLWYTFMISSFMIMFTTHLLLGKCSSNDQNSQRLCGLYYNIYLPFNYNYTPFKMILLCYQFYIILDNLGISSCCAMCPVICSQYVLVRTQVLKNELKTFLHSNEVDTYHRNLTELLQEHCKIIWLGNQVRKVFTNMLFVHFAVTSTILGISIFVALKTHAFVPVMRSICWVLFLATICNTSEQLITESTDVANTIYNSKWYQMDISTQKDLLLMMTIAQQRPLYLQSCSFSRFSLEFMLNMMKTSYSLSAVLNGRFDNE